MSDQVPAHFFRQSAVIPYRIVGGGSVEVALITSRRGRRWIIPKGVIDPGETAVQSAARETLEEAGLTGAIGETPIGVYDYRKWGGTCRVRVYLMAVDGVLERWEESGVRERSWMSPEDAARLVREPELKRMIREAPRRAVDGIDTGHAPRHDAG